VSGLRIKKFDIDDLTLVATPTTPEDLWTLYSFFEKGDLVVGRTHRVLKLESGGKLKKERVPMVVTIRLEEKNLDLGSSKLNLSGKIISGPEEYEGIKGKFQTISLLIGQQIKVIKAQSNPLSWKLLQKRVKPTGPPTIIVAIEMDNAAIGMVSDLGVLDVKEARTSIAGKDRPDERERDEMMFFEEVALMLSEFLRRSEAKVAIVGPGFAKDNFATFLERRHPLVREAVVTISNATSGTPAGIYESLRSGAVEEVTKHLRSMEEVSLVEELLKTLAKDPQKVAIGLEEVLSALQAGAVDTLLILDVVVSESIGNEKLEYLLEEVQDFGGKFYVIGSQHEGGSKLRSFGGVAALLRYRIGLGEADV